MAASDAKSYLMVAEAAAQIVSQKLEILLYDPLCVSCSSMKIRVKDTKAKLAVIQKLLSTQYRPSETTEWWRRLFRVMYYAEGFIDKFHLRSARERHKALYLAVRPLAAVVSKYMLWSDLSNLVNDMDKLCQNKFFTGKEEAESKWKDEPASSSSRDSVPWHGKKWARLTSFRDWQAPTNFLCHADEAKDIMDRIFWSPWFTEATSICGNQGTGKTFLARWVYNQSKYMGYEWRAWVHVSASMDKREFLFEILKQFEKLAREMKDMVIEEIKIMLHRKLAKVRKFILVLDDVQLSDEPLLRELMMSIPIFSSGHIICTTRSKTIASCMDMIRPIMLERLSDRESQDMLAWKLDRVSDRQGLSGLSSEEKNILDMCYGLPLCISLLGGFLSSAGEHERAALAKERSVMTVPDILQWSCHKLPVHLKPCFIYMALFPVAFPIPTRRLLRLWLAEGLLDSHRYDIERGRKMSLEDVGEMFILELENRNVIDVVSRRPDGSPKACQMLTSLYYITRPIAMSTGFIHVLATIRNPTGKQQQLPAQLLERTEARWLAEHTNVFLDSHGGNVPNLYLGHIRSFLSFYTRRGILTKDICTFLRKMTSKTNYSLLRVLDLEGVYKPSLQGVLHKLMLLRYLGLRCTVLDSLPSAVAGLPYLETLDIKHTNITSLPSSLWKARNLRHLHLNWFFINWKTILNACGNDAKALTKLQTLSGLVIGEVKENWMAGHMDSLTTLKLYLRQSDKDVPGAAGKAVADWISFRLTDLQSLTFGVTRKAKPAKEATEVARPAKEATEVARPAKEATEVAKPGKEATEEAEPAKETTKKAEPAKETTKKAKPVTSEIGPLPELSLAEHHGLLELYLLGQLNNPSWPQLLPGSLRVLTLSGSRVEADMMPQLGGLLKQLRTFRLLANSFLGPRMRFAKDGFPSLMILKIWKLPHLHEVVIEERAMLHLKELELRDLDAMERVEGIMECKELESIRVVVKQGADRFLESLGKRKGKTTNSRKIEDTEVLESWDNDNNRTTVVTMIDEDEEEEEPEDASP